MPTEDDRGELSAQYDRARDERPAADARELAELIVSRLSDDEIRRQSAVLPGFGEVFADRDTLARKSVEMYVLDREAEPDDEDDG